MKRDLWHQIYQLAIALFIIGLVLVGQFFSPIVIHSSINRLDGLAYDLKISHLPPWPPSLTNIQIVDIDEVSLNDIGRMPWSRKHFATLTTNLFAAGALVIVYDMLFSEPQVNSGEEMLAVFDQQGWHIEEAQQHELLKHFDNDGYFAKALSGGEVVVANLFHNNVDLMTGQLLASSIEQVVLPHPTTLEPYTGFATVIATLAQSSAGQGFMNSRADADGVVRRTPLLVEFKGKFYPSLALEAYRVYSLAEKISINWYQAGEHMLPKGLSVGSAHFATDSAAQMIIPFRGPAKTYPYTSAAQVFTQQIPDQRFDQAVVFVGTSAVGLADLQTTPVQLNFPGVEIHATIFDALMSPQSQPYRPDWWQGAIAIELICLGLICIGIFPRLGPLKSIVFALSCLSCVIIGNLLLWYIYFIDLPIVTPLILVLMLSVYFTGYGFLAESLRRKLVKTIFDQYVPPAHIDKLLSDPDALNLTGERKQLSVLFCDIRNFTSIAEIMPAHELQHWLNQYFSPITRVILGHGGTIDKYVGDLVMAFWGAPLEDANHAYNSITASFAMLAILKQQNQAFKRQGKPQVNVGIGINSGEMNVGDMGSYFRRNYTVIGDAVNLAARLEALTKFYQVEILVSEFTRAKAKQFQYLLIDKVRVKGKTTPVTIYMPLVGNSQNSFILQVSALNDALAHYYRKEFDTAELKLTAIAPCPTTARLVDIYLHRIAHFKFSPPATDWDGSFTHTSK